jgi:hypothetical protein
MIKSIEPEGSFKGYASVFHHLDDQGDRVLPGAFTKTLADWRRQGIPPKMLWQHNQAEPIGWWKTIHEDHKGLYVEGQLLLSLRKAQEIYEMLKNRMIDGLSIGCRVIEAEQGEKPGERLLKTIDLFEISLVTFAANTKARILTVKSHTDTNLPPAQQRLLASLNKAIKTLRSHSIQILSSSESI